MATKLKTKPRSSGRSERALARYQSMRDFAVTAEPRGKARSGPQRPRRRGAALKFVIQKHAATRLHYDFRLEWNGVLKSWAVTKGPSYFPGDKRLAVQVEDHPIEYGDFEGTIPKGQYGGGTVMVWDTGTWEPEGDFERGLADGHFKFELHGEKLKGSWALVRMHGRAGGSGKENWLLIKEKDQFARESSETPIVDEAPNSAASGRTMERIATSNLRVWDSKRKDCGPLAKSDAREKQSTPRATSPKRAHAKSSVDLSSAPRERFPGFIAPQLAESVTAAPSGANWVHELKLDGYRIQILVQPNGTGSAKGHCAKLLTRKGLDWTSRMPDIAKAAERLHVTSAILDGEAVALDERGVSNFAALQAAFHEGRQRYITYFAFDLLHLDGHNLRNLSLSDRREILEGVLPGKGEDTPVHLSESLDADGKEVFKKACALGAEGIVSKLNTAKYTPGRGSSWLKLKCHLEQELVIGGFTLPSKGNAGIGALLLGYYEDGKLIYAGRSGTGFTQKTHQMIRARLEKLKRKESPFADVPREITRSAHWVMPELVAQISFSTWTRDHLVRQAAFKGLREDKPAKEVVREGAVTPDVATRNGSSKRSGSMERRVKNKKNTTPANELAITHPEKVLDPDSGITKQVLAEYYVAVSDHLLPHIANRPLSVVRCPDGISKPCFFQKHIGLGLPGGVKSVSIRSPKSGKREDYLTVDSSEGLVGLAQLGALEIHPWGAQNDSLERPDRIVFDLDPDAAIDWPTIGATARNLRSRLKKLGLESFLKSTGGKGLHVVIPIEAKHEWPVIKDFAHRVVLEMEEESPQLYVTKMTKATRKNRIYLDYLRNDRESTSVAPFSPRARSGIPVAMPLRWNELDSAKAPSFHVTDFEEWRDRLRRDPWVTLPEVRQKLSEKALRAIGAAGKPLRRS